MSFREIVIPKGSSIELIDQPAPMLEWLKISNLVVDDIYQRQLSAVNWKAITKIAAQFRWSRFTPVLVAPVEGGRYAIIDGQHRTHAAAMCGVENVPCMVVHMPLKEQASAFAWVNGSVVKITGFHIYRAALAAGDEWAVNCKEAVEAAGCKLMTSAASTANKKAGEIYSIALVREYVSQGMAEHLTTCLGALIDSGACDHSDYFTNNVLRPWIAAVGENQKFARADLKVFLSDVDLLNVLDTAAELRKTPEYFKESRYVIARSLITKRLREFIQRAAA